ncbi:YhcH/YjgK/YiaL family protein [Pedobacter sp. P351]|uniref:YhcH/YjgK/YiaL family protein n=1 Tax=Pedobacter superstes TaxID=3133441 RepID=UPI0030B7D3BE
MLKHSFRIQLIVLLSSIIFLAGCASRKSSSSWFKQGQWYNGLNLMPYSDINKVEFETQYKKNKARWDKAFAYLKDTDLEKLAPGKYPIEGDSVFVSVTEGPDKPYEQTNWESHRKMIDVQYIVRGKERMGVADLSKATVTKPYDPARDVANYIAAGKFYVAEPGTMYIFFPTDVHRPSIKVDGYDVVKKVVIKVRYTE